MPRTASGSSSSSSSAGSSSRISTSSTRAPYQYLAVFAIRNLYELTTFRQNPNDPVPRAAEIVLDYLSARYALSSNGLRRVANFRRQPHRARYGTMFQAIGDAEFARMALLAGGSLPLHLRRWGRVHPWEVGTIVFHGTGRPYRVPDTVRDYLVRGAEHRKPDDVLQRFRSRGGQDDGGLEIHFSTPSFLLERRRRLCGGARRPGRRALQRRAELAAPHRVPSERRRTRLGRR